MDTRVYPYRLTALTPWAWHGQAVPSGTATLAGIVTDTAVAFATASTLGMIMRSPCLPPIPDYRHHIGTIPFKAALFLGENNPLLRPLARRLNLDVECGMPRRVHGARSSGNIKDYFHIQEVSVGAIFTGAFLHADPISIAREKYRVDVHHLVIRLGLGRNGMGLLEPSTKPHAVCLNLHTARLFDPNVTLRAGPYRLHNIQPSISLPPDEALQITSTWNS